MKNDYTVWQQQLRWTYLFAVEVGITPERASGASEGEHG